MTLAAEPPHMMSVTFPNNAAAAAVAAAAAMAAAQHNNGVVHQIFSPICFTIFFHKFFSVNI